MTSVATIPVRSSPPLSPEGSSGPVQRYFSSLFELTGSEVPWDRTTIIALLTLILLWAERVYTTWATWGNLSIDSGHEMYVPAVLAEGKTLYRDVWFMYPPADPYINSMLFRLFGMHLNVLYWAGSLSALGSAVLLYLIGKRMSSWLMGWTAGAVLLVEAFQAWLFNFPLPYSYAAVYGCLTGCVFLWFVVNASASESRAWIFAAGTAAAVAFLLKLEFGVACYVTLFLLIAVRGLRRRSAKSLAMDFLPTLPGLAACGLVLWWMISIGGFNFITQENIMNWPTSFFMRTYGKMWLERTGFALTGKALGQAALDTSIFAVAALEAYCLLWWKRRDLRSILLRGGLALTLLAYFGFSLHWNTSEILAAIFFPPDMVLYVAAAALYAWWCVWRQPASDSRLRVALLLTFSSLLAFRILLKMSALGYPIYYNGPTVLSFLLLVRPVVPRSGRSRWFALRAELLICLGCLIVAGLQAARFAVDPADLTRLTTERGTILVTRQVAENYKAAIRFMKEKSARGESVLSIPEDTSLYFLSGTHCPTRLLGLTPGVLAPGKMTDDLIADLERKRIPYLLWSNRIFTEFGVPVFGKDFDQPLGDYFLSHYRRVGPLVPDVDSIYQTRFTVWERKPESETR